MADQPKTKEGKELVKAHMDSRGSTQNKPRLNERIAAVEKDLIDQKGLKGAKIEIKTQIYNVKVHDLAVDSFYDPTHPLNDRLREKYGQDVGIGKKQYSPTLEEHKANVRALGSHSFPIKSARGDWRRQPQHKKLVESEHKYEMKNFKARNKKEPKKPNSNPFKRG